MPEGDTLYRTAATLQRWLGGREVTAATTSVPGLAGRRLVGQKVAKVEAWGTHLLVRFESGQTLHTHLRMSGSWHVYPAGDPWRRPHRQARLAITCGDRIAVCFNAPVVELLAARAELVHPALARLGPDVLADDIDMGGILRRARTRPGELALGELLLDQTLVAGIGNIWRCEAMFLDRHNPWTPQAAIGDEELDHLMTRVSTLMRVSAGIVIGPPAGSADSVPDPLGRPYARWVYKRHGQPCRRCGSLVIAHRQGKQARTAYWCPGCQPAVAGTPPAPES